MKTSLLMYDIPEASGFGNPSHLLRPRALRINLSNWIVDRDRTPWNLLNRMTTAGVAWHLIEFEESATPKLLAIAASMMKKELAEIASRAAASLERAQAQLTATEANPESTSVAIDQARRKFERDHEAVVKRTERVIQDLERAAGAFGMDTAGFGFDPLKRQTQRIKVAGAHALQSARAELYQQLAQAVKGTALEAPAAAGDLPAEVLADAAEEAGCDTSEARTMFAAADPTPAATANVSSSTQEVEPAARNGRQTHLHNEQRPQEPRERRAERSYRVQTRNGTRVVRSSLTNQEAAGILQDLGDRFGRSLATRVQQGRTLSANQRAWLHVLAIEAQQEQQQPAASMEPPTVQETTPNVPEINSRRLKWNPASNTFTIAANELSWDHAPEQIDVRSAKTGQLRRFRRAGFQPYDTEVLYTHQHVIGAIAGVTMNLVVSNG